MSQVCPSQFVLNLRQNTHRMERFDAMCEREGLEVDRIEALDPDLNRPLANWRHPPEQYARLCSHLLALRTATKFKNVLIFEDSCEVVPGFIEKAKAVLESMPKHWEVLYFGGENHADPQPFVEGASKCVNTRGAFCYAVNWKYIHRVVGWMKARDHWVEMLLANNQIRGGSYIADPQLARVVKCEAAAC